MEISIFERIPKMCIIIVKGVEFAFTYLYEVGGDYNFILLRCPMGKFVAEDVCVKWGNSVTKEDLVKILGIKEDDLSRRDHVLLVKALEEFSKIYGEYLP